MIKYSQALLLGVIAFVSLVSAGIAGAHFSDYSTLSSGCELGFDSSTAVPAGYGAAFDPTSGTELITCTDNGQRLNVGTGSQTEYIYKEGYAYHDGAWRPLEFTSQSPLTGDSWFLGEASVQLPFTSSELSTDWNYVVVYVCHLDGGEWKCGCSDSACTTSTWQMQGIRMAAPIPRPSVCPDSQNGDVAISIQATFDSISGNNLTLTSSSVSIPSLQLVTLGVADTLKSTPSGTSITLFKYVNPMSYTDASTVQWSCVQIN